MLIALAEAYRYRLELGQGEPASEEAPPFPKPASERQGLLVRLALDSGAVAWGDVAPLPGRSRESLEDATADLVDALSELAGVRLPGSWKGFCEMNPAGHRCAAVSFGIEQAISALSASAAGLPVSKWINDRSRPTVAVNALLSGAPDVVVATARTRLEEGYRAFKLKVGSHDASELRSLLEKLRETVGHSVELRLDANRAWSYDEAVRQLGDLGDMGISYIEEPLTDPANLDQIALAISIPVALDETIEELSGDGGDFERFAFAGAAVLKPTLLGGMIRSMDVASRFAKWNVEPVLTSAFESEIGLSGLASLAAALPGLGLAAGLDTARYFTEGLLPGKLRSFLPIVDPDVRDQTLIPDSSRLELLFRA